MYAQADRVLFQARPYWIATVHPPAVAGGCARYDLNAVGRPPNVPKPDRRLVPEDKLEDGSPGGVEVAPTDAELREALMPADLAPLLIETAALLHHDAADAARRKADREQAALEAVRDELIAEAQALAPDLFADADNASEPAQLALPI